MKRTMYFNGRSEEWVDKKPTELSFMFVAEGKNRDAAKITVYPPAVAPEFIDSDVFKQEIDNAKKGFVAWTAERKELGEENVDGIGITIDGNSKHISVSAPDGYKMTDECQTEALEAFANWLSGVEERLSPEDEDDEEAPAPAPVPAPVSEPEPEDEEPEAEEAEEPAPAPAPAPATSTKRILDDDPANWDLSKDIDDLFDGKAKLPV